MQTIALSTMWGIGRFDTFKEFAEAGKALGLPNIELNHQFPDKWLNEIQDLKETGEFIISSLHDPCPLANCADGSKPAGDLSLCCTEDAERLEAIGFAKGTIDLAHRLGAKAVVLHMGDVGNYYQHERSLRRLFAEGKTQDKEFIEGKEWLMAERTAKEAPYFEMAIKTIKELADYAGEREIKLGLENRCYYYEIPSVDEMGYLLAETDPNVVGYWHDTGHAEILHRLGFTPHSEWFARYKDRLIGSHVNDVKVITDHRAPGAGELSWESIGMALPEEGFRTLEIDSSQDVQAMIDGIALLKQHKVLRA